MVLGRERAYGVCTVCAYEVGGGGYVTWGRGIGAMYIRKQSHEEEIKFLTIYWRTS